MRIKVTNLIFGVLLISAFLLTGCANKEKSSVKDVDITQEDSGIKEESHADNPAKKLEDIEKIASESIFKVNWFTQDEEYGAGTSFLIDSPKQGEKVLVTAFHYLWPEDADIFSGDELPDFVKGGELSYSYSDESANATLKNCFVIEDASIAPDIDKDVAAFSLHNGENLKTLPLATTHCKVGDTVYLLADLWDTDDIHENCVYEGKVLGEEDGILYYELDERYGATGASGAPIVNQYGEVAGIHITSAGSIRAANSVFSFKDKIEDAKPAKPVYPEDVSELSFKGSGEQGEGEAIILN
jgi:hypothetical protein